MTNTDIKIIIYATIFLVVSIWCISFSVEKFNVYSLDSVEAVFLAITISIIFWYFFFNWGWKWPYLKRLLYKPNINGTWIGEFKSDWKDDNGNELPPGKFVMVIRQTWLSFSIRAFSELQKTQSYVEALKFDGTTGTKYFAYFYSGQRSTFENHATKQGAAQIDVQESDSNRTLEGDFWTCAGTTGFIKVRQVSCTDFVESFSQACELWEDTDLWAYISD